MSDECSTCTFWTGERHNPFARPGRCRRYPPSSDPVVTRSDDWCGEYVVDPLSRPFQVWRNKKTGQKVGVYPPSKFMPDIPDDWERLADNESVIP